LAREIRNLGRNAGHSFKDCVRLITDIQRGNAQSLSRERDRMFNRLGFVGGVKSTNRLDSYKAIPTISANWPRLGSQKPADA
jgi:hypothetical protein